MTRPRADDAAGVGAGMLQGAMVAPTQRLKSIVATNKEAGAVATGVIRNVVAVEHSAQNRDGQPLGRGARARLDLLHRAARRTEAQYLDAADVMIGYDAPIGDSGTLLSKAPARSGTSIMGAAAALFKAVVGTGIFALPPAMRACGVLLGILMSTLMSVVSLYTTWAMIEAVRELRRRGHARDNEGRIEYTEVTALYSPNSEVVVTVFCVLCLSVCAVFRCSVSCLRKPLCFVSRQEIQVAGLTRNLQFWARRLVS